MQKGDRAFGSFRLCSSYRFTQLRLGGLLRMISAGKRMATFSWRVPMHMLEQVRGNSSAQANWIWSSEQEGRRMKKQLTDGHSV